MPYRIDVGDEVMITRDEGAPIFTKMNRTVSFVKAEILASPNSDHRAEGIPASISTGFPWAFRIKDRWEGADKLLALYAKDVHVVAQGTSDKDQVIEVVGSKGKKYSLVLDNNDNPVSCSCMGYRFNRDCKHMRAYRKP